MELEKQTLNVAIFESMLKVWKTSLWHEMKLEKLKELDKIKTKNKKQEYQYKKSIKETEKYFNDMIKRSEKYNSEISNIVNSNKNIDPIIDSSIDLYSEFTDVLLSVINGSKKETKIFYPCILEKSDKGKLFHKGETFIIHTND